MGMIDDERKQAAAYAEAVRRDGQLNNDERVAYNATARALGTPRRYLRYGSTHGVVAAATLPGGFAPGGPLGPPPPPGGVSPVYRLLAYELYGYSARRPDAVRVEHSRRWQ